MRGLIGALNLVYEEEETRAFWHLQLLTLLFTCSGGVFLLIVRRRDGSDSADDGTILPLTPAQRALHTIQVLAPSF